MTTVSKAVTQLRVGARTTVGLKRDLNQDDFATVEQFKDRQAWPIAERKGNLYVVADGMGGHNAGEVASRLAVDIVAEEYYEDESVDVEGSLHRAIQEANQQIHERAQCVRSEAGMGSTVVAAVIRGDELYVAHVGDSRAYLIRDGGMSQLTRDHSWVSEQLEREYITLDEARTHPHRNYITRSLGVSLELEVDCSRWMIRQGDIVCLCSDGLSGQVDDETIQHVVSMWEPQDACEELVRLADEAGGPDNITAIVIRVESAVPVPRQIRRHHLRQAPKLPL